MEKPTNLLSTAPLMENFKCKAARIQHGLREIIHFDISFKNGKIFAKPNWDSSTDNWEGTYSGDGSFIINSLVGSGVYKGYFVRPNSLSGLWNDGTRNGTFEFILTCDWYDLKRIINYQKLREIRLTSKLIPEGEGFDFVSQLPTECVVFIFQIFTVKELALLSLVCKDWKDITDINTIWKKIYKNYFKNSFLVYKKSDQHKSSHIPWKEWFKGSINDDPAILTDMVVREGSYQIKGFTQNDFEARNITRLSPTVLHLLSTEDPNSLKVSCISHYGAGHDCNPESSGTWTGKVDKVTRAITISEKLKTYRGTFDYEGQIGHFLIKGTYGWTHGTTGTFELSPNET